MDYSRTYLCGLANFLAYGFPLVCIVFLDRGKQRCALLSHQHWLTAVSTIG